MSNNTYLKTTNIQIKELVNKGFCQPLIKLIFVE